MISNRVKYLLDFGFGDGSINFIHGSKGGHYSYKLTHSVKQLDYLQHKMGILEDLGFTGHFYQYTRVLNGKEYGVCDYALHVDPDIATAHKYLINKGRKAVDKHLLSVMDARSLAYWYLDDGSPNKTNKSSSSPGNGFRYYYTYAVPKLSQFRLYSFCFTREEHDLLRDWFYEKFNISVLYVNCKRDGLYLKIANLDDRKRFIDVVSPFIPNCMSYKIDGLLSYSGIEPIKVEKKEICIHGERLNEETPTDLSEDDAIVQDVQSFTGDFETAA